MAPPSDLTPFPPRLQGATGWAAVSWTLKRVWVASRLDAAGARRAATTRGALLDNLAGGLAASL
jgi:hypothetical protein